MIVIIQEIVCKTYAKPTSFYVRNLSIHGYWYPWTELVETITAWKWRDACVTLFNTGYWKRGANGYINKYTESCKDFIFKERLNYQRMRIAGTIILQKSTKGHKSASCENIKISKLSKETAWRHQNENKRFSSLWKRKNVNLALIYEGHCWFKI